MDLAPALPLLDRALLDDTLLVGWERVRDNAGGPGIDGITLAAFGRDVLARLPELRRRVLAESYVPHALRRIELVRPGKAPRILAVPTVADRVVQSAVALTLTPLLDPEFEDFSFGYRPGRSVPRAVQRLCDARDAGFTWVAEADIQSCFDHIPWAALLQRLDALLPDASLLPLIRLWLGLPLQYPDGHQQARCMGVPQGSPLSPLLSNVHLDGLDKALADGPWRAVRYADDFVIAAASAAQAQTALQRASAWLRSQGLRLNREKTRVVHFDQGFSFLGVCFRGRQISAERPGTEPWVLPRPTKAKARAQAAARQPAPDRPQPMQHPVRPQLHAEPARPAPAPTTTPLKQLAEQQAAAVQPPAEPAAPRLRPLYLTEPGAYLHIDGERFIVGKGGEELASIPAEKLDQVIADTEGAVSFGALRLLLRHDATLLLTPSAPGDPAGLLVPMNGRQVQLRAAQFARLSDGPFRLAVAVRLVQAKIANARVLLRRYRRFRPEGDRNEDQRLAQLQSACLQVASLDALRGFEGNAARIHFDALSTLLGPGWAFDTRNRQPPKDPINALLSYGYTVLFHTVHTLILRRGLDPFVGALHAPRDGHAALASDLMEPYRSLIVDATALRLITQGGVRPEHFHAADPGRLPVDIKRQYIRLLEAKLSSPVGRDGAGDDIPDWRRIIERDVNAWATAVQGNPEQFTPWTAR